MRTAAILPVKNFAKAKQRLSLDLPAHDRRALAESMFADALVALGRVATLERVIVVSGDRHAQRIAGGYGASAVEDDERGHNAAAARGKAIDMTWPNGALIPPIVRIDHLLTGTNLAATAIAAGPGFGSDHRYLTATVAIRP